ncbi:transcriptional regulator of sulfur amino acid metabolism [Nothophoma quercina]|uniref:Transcriptional regulator of sulfur amino acid metabolism n=1 Tax=Nothophoma quercina TaxID=749835 RepID=A0ABR3R7F7_9PLEO
MHKYPFTNHGTVSQSSQAPTTIASVGNLLTPPSTIHGDVISPTSGVSTSGAASTTMAYSQYNNHIYSPPTQHTPSYGYPPAHSQQQNQYGQQSRAATIYAIVQRITYAVDAGTPPAASPYDERTDARIISSTSTVASLTTGLLQATTPANTNLQLPVIWDAPALEFHVLDWAIADSAAHPEPDQRRWLDV